MNGVIAIARALAALPEAEAKQAVAFYRELSGRRMGPKPKPPQEKKGKKGKPGRKPKQAAPTAEGDLD